VTISSVKPPLAVLITLTLNKEMCDERTSHA